MVGERPSTGRIVAIGCFMAWIGGISGAMIAVLVSKGVASLSRVPSCDGIPSCDWYIYAAVGGALGFVTLPWLVISALRRPPAPGPGSSEDTF